MTSFDDLHMLSAALIELDEETTLEKTHALLAAGEVTPVAIVHACQQAMRVVGERYEKHEYYLSGLIVAGELFKTVLDLLEPFRMQLAAEEHAGTIVLGTAAGDIHDIGKNMFAGTLQTFGFTVVDLGVDVAPERFLEAVRDDTPDVVCLSGLITSSYEGMKRTVELIRANAAHLDPLPPIIIGGGTVNDAVCRFVGADSWSTDSMEGVRICQRLVARNGVRDQR